MKNLKASLVIGAISVFLSMLLFATGLPTASDALLLKWLAIPQDGRPLVGTSWLMVCVFAFGVAWVWVDLTKPVLKTSLSVAALVLLATWAPVLSLHGKFFSPVLPIFAVLCTSGFAYGWGKTRHGQRNQLLERLFGLRLPKSAFQSILASDVSPDFPGRVVNASVLVIAVQNHAELMELLPPESYTAITNLYLKTASDYLVDSGAYLDECNGECIRVVFGAPIGDPRHAVRACRAAIDLAARLDDLNKECDARWQRRLDVRMGLDTGDIIAGVFGGGRLGSFSVAGPAVDFARRLCAASSLYGARILIGPDAYTPASESVEVRPIEILKVAEKRRRVEIYEILAPKHALSPERERSRDHFWTGVLHYRERQWDKAVDEFTKARITGIPDAALDFYLRRIEQARRPASDAHKESVPALFHAA
jgi:class 3 adenylate cyclase